ncbi:uncharacterized protein LOC118193239 [Stegodyphus dumicola]|uniref:uncharacterized protein LOC118193239 n=1 Tax=Stegodyphus dumicola TaxID=202533 RepID=UPI0015A92440|nr:uncharacterized protein LOC118193239 [Stegodyphus dumicola]
MGCPQYILNFIKSYLTNRRVQISTEHGTVSQSVDRGCPQGSCFGSLFWITVANSLFPLFDHLENLWIIAYADDFLLIAAGRSNVTHRAQLGLDIFVNWAQQHKITLSPGKTQALAIGRRSVLRRNPTLKLFNESIHFVSQFKFLGVIFDNKLSWLPHFKYLHIRNRILLNSFLEISGSSNWGVPPHFLKLWYKVVTERIFLYASSIWGAHLTRQKRRILKQLQRPCLLSITKSYRTASTLALQTLAETPPLDLLVEREVLLTRVLRLGFDFSLWGQNYRSIQFVQRPDRDLWAPSEFDVPKRITLDNTVVPQARYAIFTDGSKFETGVGSALCVLQNGNVQFTWQCGLHVQSSVYQAELIALRKAVRLSKLLLGPIVIFTDSASSLQSLLRIIPLDPLVQDIQNLLQALSPADRTWLTWVPAHVGIRGNELADELAKVAALSVSLPKMNLPLPVSSLKRDTWTALMNQWQMRWDGEVVGRRTFAFIPKVSTALLGSSAYRTWFLTGHGPFPSFLHRFNLRFSNLFPCGSLGDPDHYAFHCPFTSSFHLHPPSRGNISHIIEILSHNDHALHRLYNTMQFCAEYFN